VKAVQGARFQIGNNRICRKLDEVTMDESEFEGTLVLEQLAAIGKVEEFFDAVDADDVRRAIQLMKNAGVVASTIAIVVRKMEESDGQH
jgi:hypothetical protein